MPYRDRDSQQQKYAHIACPHEHFTCGCICGLRETDPTCGRNTSENNTNTKAVTSGESTPTTRYPLNSALNQFQAMLK